MKPLLKAVDSLKEMRAVGTGVSGFSGKSRLNIDHIINQIKSSYRDGPPSVYFDTEGSLSGWGTCEACDQKFYIYFPDRKSDNRICKACNSKFAYQWAQDAFKKGYFHFPYSEFKDAMIIMEKLARF